MTNSLNNLTVAQLKRAIEIKERIEALERELNTLSGTSGASAGAAANGQNRGKTDWSAAKRARMAAMKKAWWASRKRVSGRKASARKPRRKLSAAAHANIARAARERWARARAAGKI